MSESTQDFPANYIELTADIVAAYVSNNSVPITAVADLLSSVHAAVSGLATGGNGAVAEDKIEKPTPAQIKKSITPDGLISFEDGKPYKTLRRHLTIRGLSPEAYRVKYGLPADYPMTSANYSAARSALAKQLGLGQQRHDASTAAAASAPREKVMSETLAPEKKRVGRLRKAAEA